MCDDHYVTDDSVVECNVDGKWAPKFHCYPGWFIVEGVNGPAFFYLISFLYEILKSFLTIRKNQKIQVELSISSILPKVVKISY